MSFLGRLWEIITAPLVFLLVVILGEGITKGFIRYFPPNWAPVRRMFLGSYLHRRNRYRMRRFRYMARTMRGSMFTKPKEEVPTEGILSS